MIKRIKLRTLLIGGIITLFFAVLMGRVFWVQVVEAEFWQAYAEKVWSKKKTIPASRGKITDRNGKILAVDAPAYTVAINPKLIHQLGIQEEIVQGLHDILGKSESELRELVNAKKKDGAFYNQREVRKEGWKVDQDVKDKVEKLQADLMKQHNVDDVGIILIKGQKRYYPSQSLAAHILGYVNRDSEAVEGTGVEAYYDEELKGQDGSLEYKSDGRGIEIPKASEIYTPVKNGKDIQLTIDYTIQYYVEEAMNEAYADLKPISMTVIAADPKTMEILALANLPTYNPNEYWKDVDQKNFYNHATKSVYEPGSTFKIVTLAGAVQEGLFNPNESFMSGSIRVPGQTIHDVKRSGWGAISYLEGVKRSSNVAFVKLGYEKLGPELLKQYVDNFGFGQRTGIELPGEAKGAVTPVYQADFAAMSYGHGQLLVTPIQQVAAVAAVANGGKLMEPHIVKSVTDPHTGETTMTQPKVIRNVLSPDKAKEISGYLEQVVSDRVIGTGRHAYIEGYRIAGKTGTAIKPGKGGYDSSKQVVSYIGYAPVDDPQIIVLVLIDEPINPELGGGSAAGPVVKKIMNQALQHMGVPKQLDDQAASPAVQAANVLKVPDLDGMPVQEAKDLLKSKGISYATLGNGSKVISQFPKPGSQIKSSQHMYILTEEGQYLSIPNVKGQSLRDAVELLSVLQVSIKTVGEGYVVEQQVSEVQGQRQVTLILEPLNPGQADEEADASSDGGDKHGDEDANVQDDAEEASP
ncbi:penicillin-binding transpeptidase domain-containing protein [Paenibacillus fonticola]|uniref:penicillin-binding transpeptidase domain-containing protein n=1 Tax=Paenibacillus fonticola TaxID=379896 RepID=UPI00035FE968|nr:penicillin-binding transpeptidase domain-containing protein [Paenibacillus fonticola]